MKKALMLRGLLAAATLSLGSVALAGTAGATNLTVGMYVGTNADNVTGSTIGGWWSTAFSGTWQDLTTATATGAGELYTKYLDCKSASNTDCTLRVVSSLASQYSFFFQAAPMAAINADLAEFYGCETGDPAFTTCVADGYNVGTASDATATYDTYDLTNSNSEASLDINAGPAAWGAYTRYAVNFNQLKAVYTISESSGGTIGFDGGSNVNLAGRGVNNTVFVGDGNTCAIIEPAQSGSDIDTLNVQDMSFKNFTCNNDGAALWAGQGSTVSLKNVSFVNNNTNDAYGAIYNLGALTITGGRFVNNVAYRGGAIYSNSGSLSIDGSEFSGNVADYSSGGAIYVRNDFTITNSSFDHNLASDYGDGGAVFVQSGNGSITNSTFFANVATEYGGAVNQYGGGLSMMNDTFVGNRSVDGGAAIVADSGTGNTVVGSSLFVNNTTAGMQNACTTFSYWPYFVSAGGNVVQAGPGSGCIFGSHDKVVNSFKLGAYGFHGGMAQTIPLVAKSVGTAFAPRATCQAKDARGVSRGTTGTCDAGAYQVTKK